MTTLEQAADELYAADPDEFVDRRRALAAAAREQGDAEVAKAIAALRKAGPISVFISRKEKKVYVRHKFAPLFAAPV
ncbi:MAG TPA: hypothetical protein VGJ59_21445, partial [Jatrophihabitantaceae bacterium]